ncbi:MAG: hypothetical protein CL608_06400 [Anaerolineaceae bacterium]|nr:hypothetical protein [Anaerolineaceae bacterium]
MSQEKIEQTYENNEQIRTAVNRLIDLLEWLHAEPSPDVLTLRDYRTRYRLNGLKLAATAIDRYQRINRAIGNHVQLGLCEYHIGLIYLHEGVFRGAVTQFDQARQQWSFVNQSAAVALTHLARALALRQAGHYESAMVSAGRVAGWLERARLAKPILGWHDFERQVLEYVAELQAELRELMEHASETAEDETETEEPGTEDVGTVKEEPAAQHQAPVPEPDPEAETRPDGGVVTRTDTPLPISNMDRAASSPIPVPGHRLLEDRYDWYLVEVRPPSDFMHEIHPGDWLLVDMQPKLTKDLQDTEQPILIVKKEEIDGTIRVRPLDPREKFQRIYLVTLADSPTGSFWRDEETGTVSFSNEMAKIGVNRAEILGVVVGFWRPMVAVLPNDS